MPPIRFFRSISIGSLVFLLVTPTLHAQADLEGKPTAVLVEDLKGKMSGGLVQVRPLLVELAKRLEGEPEQETYVFLIGLSYQDEYAEKQDKALLTKATEHYADYLQRFGGGSRVEFVRFNLAGAYADLDEVDKAIEHFDWLYKRGTNAIYRTESRNRMAALYIKSERAAEGIPLFLNIFSAAVLDPELRAQAAAWLLQGYLAAGEPSKILPYLRYLTGRFEAVYDPAFNVTLLKTGDELFQKENYDQAILLYSFVKSRAQIIEFYDEWVNSLELKLRYVSPESDQYMVVEGQLNAAKARLEAVQAIREYNVDMSWRMARVYKETNRTWESLWAFIHLYSDHPEHEQAEDFLYTAYTEARSLNDDVTAEDLALKYMDRDGFSKFRGHIIMGLADMYSRAFRYDDLMELVNNYLEKPENYMIAAQLVNVVGSYYIREGAFYKLRDYMEPRLKSLKGKEPAFEAVRYWSALSYLLLADYPRASSAFETFIADYDERSIYYEDVYYRYAIALFGEEKSQESEAQFLKFVAEFPESNLRGEAELYIGDLMRARGAPLEAAEHYRKVEGFTNNAAFISKAVFALSEVLEEAGEPQEAVDVLKAYVEKYGERGELAEAYHRIGMIFDRLGRLDDRFKIHVMAIEELIPDVNRYAVDELITGYVRDWMRYDRSFRDSIHLLDRLIGEDEFRRRFLTDRTYQYQFMQSAEGVQVHRDLSHLLVRDREFRARVVEPPVRTNPDTGQPLPAKPGSVTAEKARETLRELKEVYDAKMDSIRPFDPETVFTSLVARGKDRGDKITHMRAQMGLDLMEPGPTPPRFDWEDLEIAPPAVIIWEGSKHKENRPSASKALFQRILDEHPYSKSVYDALLAMGEISLKEAERTGENADWEEALGYYDTITERYAMRASAMPYLRKGRILSELSRDGEAIDLLGQVLRNPKWKGLDHAKAHLELGLAYRRQNQLAEAHGFFERLIVAYGGYAETVAWAYYYDLLTLEAMGENESVRQLLDEYRTRLTVLSKTEAHTLIDEKFKL